MKIQENYYFMVGVFTEIVNDYSSQALQTASF